MPWARLTNHHVMPGPRVWTGVEQLQRPWPHMEADTEAQRNSRGCPRSHSQSWYVAIDNLSSLTPAYALLSLLMGLRVPTWRGEQRPGI